MRPFSFTTPRLDRHSHKRDDPAFIAAALVDPSTRIVVFSNGECLIEGPETWRLRLLDPSELEALGIVPWPPVFLGVDTGRALFAVEVDATQRERIERAHFVELWRNASRLPDHEATIFAYAKGMLEWHARHRYCGRSGAANLVTSGGHRLLGGEEHAQFPRVDPAIIVLVQRGDECLLGRKAGWPEDRYATIAGFVEPGESLEDAVRREVKEETNIDVDDVTYMASQPWPFPSSLMVGFHALATGADPIALNDKELADARWFTRDDIASHRIRIPPAMSIAFYLIEQWFDQAGGPTLREVTSGQRWA
jgi:NAD+ diphosphatase